MDAKTLKEKDKQYIANTYARFDLAISSGKGSIIHAEDKDYIDFGAGIAVSSFGISDETWLKAITEQAGKLSHSSNLYYTEPSVKLAELICEKTQMKKVFFSNSGAEANECAIKTARKYSFDKYGHGRYEIITLKNSFHGRTMATLSATGQDSFHNIFNPFLEGFKYAPANDIDALKKLVSPKTCAVMLEIIQGEGGLNLLDKAYIQFVAKLCAEKDLLLIIDEVQTGNGRTGMLYAYMNFALKPDIVTTAKGLGGGLPLGATILNDKVADTLCANSHGSTFGANPICCAGAYSILSRLDSKFLSDVKKKGDYLKTELEKLEGVKMISGLGLMLGLTVVGDAKEIAKECLSHGLLVLTAKDKIRLVPALNISYKDLDSGIKILSEVLK
ncbi:MAG TPA: acetylornithine/succinylornithine family transaminase [Clostridia bacterium]|nr:acetylornithine/succinylornithine family transaminase [Clostridia bacterium]